MDSNMTNPPSGAASSSGIIESAKEAAQSAKETVQEKARQARDQLHEAGGRISSAVRDTTSQARAQGEEMLRDQKSRVAERIGTYGSAVHRAAHQLEDEHDAAIAFYVHRAADQLDRMSGYLREHDWNSLRHDVENFARRHQELFFGGLLLCGVAAARVLKASRQEETFQPEPPVAPSTSGQFEEELAARYEAPYEPMGGTNPQAQPGATSGAFAPTDL